MFADRSFFESLRLEPYYGYTATQVPRSSGFLSELIAATRARQVTLVHGDFSPKNLLLEEDLRIHPLLKAHPLAKMEIAQGIEDNDPGFKF